jgi:hypothetical protein
VSTDDENQPAPDGTADGEAPKLPTRAAIYIDPDGTVHFGALFEGLVPVADALGTRKTTREQAALSGPGTDLGPRSELPLPPLAAPAIEDPAERNAMLEKLTPLLMRPVYFAIMHEQLGMSALRPNSLGMDDEFNFLPRDGRIQGFAAEPTSPGTRAGFPDLIWVKPGGRRRAGSPRRRLPELVAARPQSFRIDDEGLVPAERDAPVLFGDRPRPPAPGHFLRKQEPLVRAPIAQIDGTAFRMDPVTGLLPNESIIEARPQPELPSWYLLDYDRDFYRRWTPMIDIWALGPLQNEWFSYWWTEFREQALGGFPYFPFREDREIKWLIILRCKEQMMIRRDVPKLETPPELEDPYVYEIQGIGILQHERLLKLAELIEKPTWVEITRIVREDRGALHPWLDAYSDWRALKSGLEEQEGA